MATTSEQDVRELIRQPEGPNLEFKSNTPDAATISQVLGAFANTEGGALVVGVREGGDVVGADMSRLHRVVERVRGGLNPPQEIRLDTYLIDGKQLGVVRIGKSPAAPVFTDAGVFVRRGTQARPMSTDDLMCRLREVPGQFDEAVLASAIAKQTVLIETLRLDLRNANCWQSKMKDYLFGGIIGAILGALASLIIK
jgi:predicted HTH transcriptional regulator